MSMVEIICLALVLVAVKCEQDIGFKTGQRLSLNPENIKFAPEEQGNYKYKHHRGHHALGHNHSDKEQVDQQNDLLSPINSLIDNNNLGDNNVQAEGSNNLVMLAELKGSAVIKKVKSTKFTETIQEKNHNNDSKLIIRDLDQRGMEDSNIQFRSGAEVHNNRTAQVKHKQGLDLGEQNSEQVKSDMASGDLYNKLHDQIDKLKRMKREDSGSDRKAEKKKRKEERRKQRKEKRKQKKKQQANVTIAPTAESATV